MPPWLLRCGFAPSQTELDVLAAWRNLACPIPSFVRDPLQDISPDIGLECLVVVTRQQRTPHYNFTAIRRHTLYPLQMFEPWTQEPCLGTCLKLFEGHCGLQQGLVIICVLFTIQRRPVALTAAAAASHNERNCSNDRLCAQRTKLRLFLRQRTSQLL